MGKKFDERTNKIIENGYEHKFQNGINNSVLILLSFLIIRLVVDNYLSYGIIKTPCDFVKEFLEFLHNFGWILPTYFATVVVQFLFCIGIEKLLFYEIIFERVGLMLQVFNTLLVYNVLSIIYFRYNINSAGGLYMIGIYIHSTLKFWSYSYNNRKLRFKYKKEENPVKGKATVTVNENSEAIIPYPENINLCHLIEFVLGTGTLIYKNEKPKKGPRDIKLILKRSMMVPILCLFSAFVGHQYIVPESEKAFDSLNNGHYLETVSSVYKLTVLCFSVWIAMFYFHNYKCLIPLGPMIFGNEEVVFIKDWWNCTTTTNFWSHWNYQTHLWFKYHVFIPVMEMGYTKFHASVAVSIISGLLHEYLVSIPFQCCYGIPSMIMISQIFFLRLTNKLQKNYGDNVGNIATLVMVYFSHAISYFFMYSWKRYTY